MAVGLVLAVFVGLRLMYQVSLMPPQLSSKDRASGLASAQVFIAARDEPTADLQSTISDTLPTRALLLANLMSTSSARSLIERYAGLKKDQVEVRPPADGPAPLPLPLAVDATTAAGLAVEPNVLTVNADGQIPIISIGASSPTAAQAERVVHAAARTLGRMARSSSGPALVVESLGPPGHRTVVAGPRKTKAIVVMPVLFIVWCSGIVLVSGLAGRRRARRRAAQGTLSRATTN
jgi:hypothetical protein